MKFTYYGHSCFLVTINSHRILFDPFITGNEQAKDIRIEDINADYIFVSHGHYDHSQDVIRIAELTGATVVCSWELFLHFSKNGVKKLQPLNPGGKFQFDFGLVKAVIAQHSSSLQDGSYAGAASGFVFTTPEGTFYYSGDTALTQDMLLINQYAQLDFAVLPIGDVLTMGYEDAAEAAKIVNTRIVIGVHYDTFEFIKLDRQSASRHFENMGLTLLLPEIGETININ